MRRALALLALATAAALAAWVLHAPAPAPARAPGVSRAPTVTMRAGGGDLARGAPPAAERGCKPLGPLEVRLLPDPGDGPPTGPVSFSIRPLCTMQQVSWRWELSPGLVLSSGEFGGNAAADGDAITWGAAEFSVPGDGAFHAATLIVTGTFAGADQYGETGPETVSVSSRLTWGEMPSPVDEVLTRDAETGLWLPVAVVPSVHEATR